MVKDNNTEWMIAIDGLRPPGQICYGYLGTFRSLLLSIRYLGIALVLLPPHIGSWFLVCLGECQLKFPESGQVMLSRFLHGRLFDPCVEEGSPSVNFVGKWDPPKKYSTPMGPLYIGKSLGQTGKSCFSIISMDLLVARLFKNCFSHDCT